MNGSRARAVWAGPPAGLVEDRPIAQEPPAPGSPGGPQETGHDARRRRSTVVATVFVLVAAMLGGLGVAWATHPRAATLSSVEAKVDPAVVDVVATLYYGAAGTAGTGIVLTSNGLVLTNNHVIDGATSLRVTDVGNGATYTATVVGYDATVDVAVLQLQGASGLAVAALGDSSKVTIGQQVTAIGNAGGAGGTPSATTGTVTALDQTITAVNELRRATEVLTGLIETDAAVLSGDSGGPLADSAGEVIGLDVAASSGFQVEGAAGSSFAIPINEAVSVANQIVAGQSSSTVHIGATAFLGVEVGASPGLAGGGASVIAVVPGSPAASGGLAAGDVITSVGDRSIDSASALTAVMRQLRPGDRVAVTWLDQTGEQHTAAVVLAAGPAG